MKCYVSEYFSYYCFSVQKSQFYSYSIYIVSFRNFHSICAYFISSLYLSTLTFRLNLLSFVDVAVHFSTLTLYTSQVQIFEDILFQGTTNAKNNLCTNDKSATRQPSNLFLKMNKSLLKANILKICVC